MYYQFSHFLEKYYPTIVYNWVRNYGDLNGITLEASWKVLYYIIDVEWTEEVYLINEILLFRIEIPQQEL